MGEGSDVLLCVVGVPESGDTDVLLCVVGVPELSLIHI